MLTFPGCVKIKLINEIKNLIENEKVTSFYSGGKGNFDWLCAKCVKEVKKEYPFIESYLIRAYMPKEKEKSKNELLNLFDGSIYPELEGLPYRLAILKRNEWMVDNSNFLITYITHAWGGAYKTLSYARNKKLFIINLNDRTSTNTKIKSITKR